MKSTYLVMLAALAVIVILAAAPPAPWDGKSASLSLPHTMSSPEYQRILYKFLDDRVYEKLGWARDKYVRDTGPYIDKSYYGTHNAVRIFYSPEVMTWLSDGRKGRIPDGAIIIKEMFSPPAARYDSMSSAALDTLVSSWAVMVRDSVGSKDGWYWSFYSPGQKVDDPDRYPFDYPNSDFGEYCVRCHASAEKEFTFSATRNIEGWPGDPLTFRVDNSWIPPAQSASAAKASQVTKTPQPDAGSHSVLANAPLHGLFPAHVVNSAFMKVFNEISSPAFADVQHLPPVTYDHVISGPGGPGQFLTSDQCLSCHDGQGLPFGPNMYIPMADGKNINLSPYGEWNWSMMGLAGRDPIFFAQLESEIALQPTHADSIQNLCFTCHGVMGKRQLTIDHPGTLFNKEMVQVSDMKNPYFKYGALARDGISCTVCHQIVDDHKPLIDIVTGNFEVSRPGEFEKGVSYIYGPFSSPSTRAMDSSLGMKPVQSSYIQSSRLCASCHTVHLPVYNSKGVQLKMFFEQSTYLEWQNSRYQNEFGKGGSDPRTCQDCHMPTRFPDRDTLPSLIFRIANIQDQTYPEADSRAPLKEITVPLRPEFARHTLLGINQFGLEMFRQFDDILGVRTTDYMTGSNNGLPFAIATSDTLAKTKSVDVALSGVSRSGRDLKATVKVTNLTGHRFPSGVGFRRTFLELKVLDAGGKVIWASGATDSLGIIVGGDGQPLPTEFFRFDPVSKSQLYQPHYVTITRQDQVQIYEELIKNPQDSLTTSFLALFKVIKDNRLLPIGWTKKGPSGFEYADETMPHGNVLDDPQFLDGTGSDVINYAITLPAGAQPAQVVATMYYQSIPPSYLRDRFTTAPTGKATQRLYYLASHLNLQGTNITDWKLRLSSASAKL
jgi:hypothetical protein